MRVFICHSTLDSKFVIQVASLLKPNFEEVFYYETQQRADEGFQVTIDEALRRCDHLLVFEDQDLANGNKVKLDMHLRKRI